MVDDAYMSDHELMMGIAAELRDDLNAMVVKSNALASMALSARNNMMCGLGRALAEESWRLANDTMNAITIQEGPDEQHRTSS